MASDEWYLPGSDSESEKNTQQSGSTCLELGGIRIPPWRFIELMQVSATPGILNYLSVYDEYNSGIILSSVYDDMMSPLFGMGYTID